jgi:hypothetical protein
MVNYGKKGDFHKWGYPRTGWFISYKGKSDLEMDDD